MVKSESCSKSDIVSKKARKLLSQNPAFHNAEISSLEHLAGDSSGRRYLRLYLKNAPESSVVMMLLAGLKGPVYAGDQSFSQDEACFELAPYLLSIGVPVPKIIAGDVKEEMLLLEDFGDLSLAELIKSDAAKDKKLKLYKEAISVIKKLQSHTPEASCKALTRALTFNEYRTEVERFCGFYKDTDLFSKSELKQISESFDKLCKAVAEHKQVIIHRDLMPWNIQVLSNGAIGILDFQDALIGSYAYDLVSLIHDRDADRLLGDALCKKVFDAYVSTLNADESFLLHYYECVLQRHLRLVGQFKTLSEKTGKSHYADWIPGCLWRIGRALPHVDYLKPLLETLSGAIPEVKEASKEPWSFAEAA